MSALLQSYLRLNRSFCVVLLLVLNGVAVATKPVAAQSKFVGWAEELDVIIDAGLDEAGVEPYPTCSDEVFVRRIYLDVVGRIPTATEATEFLDSKKPRKRALLISELLDSPGYVHHFYTYWADLLRAKTQIAGNGQSTTTGLAYADWIKDSLRSNKRYDMMVRELLTADGLSIDNGAVGFYIRDYGMPLDQMAVTTQVFLGTQVVCAQCHDHPFDTWKQKDYFELAAYSFGMVTTNQAPVATRALNLAKSRKHSTTEVSELRRASSEILKPLRFTNVYPHARLPKLPSDYQYDNAKPKQPIQPNIPAVIAGHGDAKSAPTAPLLKVKKGEAPNFIHSYANWMTSTDNDRFAQVIANRLWKKVMGAGVVEPVDEYTENTTPSNPELLARLHQLMVGTGFDMKRYLRVLYNTRAYQREAHGEDLIAGEPYHFQGPLLRRMTAEQIWDSINTLVVDDPDAFSLKASLTAKDRYDRIRLLADGVYGKQHSLYLRDCKKVRAVQKRLSAEIVEISEKLQAARDAEDAFKIKFYAKQGGAKRRELAAAIQEIVYLPTLRQPGASELTSAVVDDASATGQCGPSKEVEHTGNKPAQGEAISEGMSAEIASCKSIDEISRVLNRGRRESLEEFYETRKIRERDEWGIRSQDELAIWKRLEDFRKSGNLDRSSDISSPAPNGHFLRAFGQSDRELVENANEGASITQALQLLNGRAISVLENRYARINRLIDDFEDPSDRVDALFLSMLSRLPDAEERELFLPLVEGKRDRPARVDTIWPILNSREFIFIQ